MLALAGIEISSRFFPGLNTGLIGELSLVHDIPELKTNDMPTFDVTDEQLAEKHAREAAVMPSLLQELPQHLADLLVIYEEQEIPEAKFVKHLDKNLPYAVDINGAGIKVMNEDYNVYTAEQMLEKNEINEKRFREKFPYPSHEPLHLAHTYLANKFALKFDEA
jgi:5'-deoxynucleotidase YfbR-like HD superfamily hydrolase